MSLFGIHLKTFTDEQWHNVVKPALAAAGHKAETFALSEAEKLVAATKARFPNLIASIRKGIADATSKDIRGVEKLEAVALDAVAALPAVLAAIPQAKDFAIQLVQSVFNDGRAELEKVAGEVLAKL